MGLPDTKPCAHAWGPGRWRLLHAASQGIAAFSACCLPQISHVLLRVFERCEPDTSRPASATLTAILQHPAWVCLALSTGRPSCAPCIIVGARRRRRRCGAITTAQTTIFQHPAGVPLTLSAGCPIWAELIPIGACRRRWRGSRRCRCRGGRPNKLEVDTRDEVLHTSGAGGQNGPP